MSRSGYSGDQIRAVHRRLRNGEDMASATRPADADGSMIAASNRVNADEAFNTRYGSYRGWQMAIERVNPIERDLAPINLTHPCSAMINLIGIEPNSALAEVPGATVHMYAKAPKPGRKIGHCTITADSYDQLDQRIKQAEAIYKPLLLTDPV